MDDDRAMPFIVFVDIEEIEPFRQRHIQLNGSALPGSSQGIFDMDVDFGSVEGAVSFVDLIILVIGDECGFQTGCGKLPLFIGADGFFRACGKLEMKTETECTVKSFHQVEHPQDLLMNLIRGHKHVGVVLMKRPNPEQTG